VEQGHAGSSSGRREDRTLRVSLAAGLTAVERVEHISNLVRRLVSSEALPGVTMRVAELNERHFGVPVRRVMLRDQYSRWGSCSASGTISLNFRLLMAPPGVLDSVIIHELAHLKHMNHSPEFWALVRQAMPDYDAARNWLRANAARLGVPQPDEADG
jgi:predicted metal-dependent hydrolase